jgi:hypothetical protein
VILGHVDMLDFHAFDGCDDRYVSSWFTWAP